MQGPFNSENAKSCSVGSPFLANLWFYNIGKSVNKPSMEGAETYKTLHIWECLGLGFVYFVTASSLWLPISSSQHYLLCSLLLHKNDPINGVPGEIFFSSNAAVRPLQLSHAKAILQSTSLGQYHLL